MLKSRIFYVANMSFNAIRENKILAKVSELTVLIGVEWKNVERRKGPKILNNIMKI